MSNPLYTLKVTTGSPHLAKELQRIIHETLRGIESSEKVDAGYKKAAVTAVGNVRIFMGGK